MRSTRPTATIWPASFIIFFRVSMSLHASMLAASLTVPTVEASSSRVADAHTDELDRSRARALR
jgi:hypothetical protein